MTPAIAFSSEFCEIFKDTYFVEYLQTAACELPAFFRSNTFFQLSLSVAYVFNELSLQCYLSVVYFTFRYCRTETHHVLNVGVFFFFFLHLGLFMSCLCDQFVI